MTCIQAAAQAQYDTYHLFDTRFGIRLSGEKDYIFCVGKSALLFEQGASFQYEKAPGYTFKPDFKLAYRTNSHRLEGSDKSFFIIPCSGRLSVGDDISSVIFLVYRDDQTDINTLEEFIHFIDLRGTIVKPSENILYSELRYAHIAERNLFLVFKTLEKKSSPLFGTVESKAASFTPDNILQVRDELYQMTYRYIAEKDYRKWVVNLFLELPADASYENRTYFTSHEGSSVYMTYEYLSDDQKFSGRYTEKLFNKNPDRSDIQWSAVSD
jgi:hypothetical protein